METELFSASSKGIIKALGIEVEGDIKNIHIIIDGVDISKVAAYEEVRIVLKKDPQAIPAVLVVNHENTQ